MFFVVFFLNLFFFFFQAEDGIRDSSVTGVQTCALPIFDAGPKGAVIAFRNKSFANPEGLIAFIREEGAGVKLQPDHRLIYYADWETPEERLAGTRDLLRRLVDIAGQVKKAA